MSICFGNIQPGYRASIDEPFFLGSTESKNLEMSVKIFANNLPKPIESSLRVEFEVILKPSIPLEYLKV